ncbi:MAG: ABC transporter substrate-binding protein [Pseudorhodoplanes sp.]|uniref:ABC transporter substrate-binding protein n=1 Tax=Pseudorhodoplanes sp. TaxID=1934341 RepID=UPI003D0DC544
MKRLIWTAAFALLMATKATTVQAEVKVGVILSSSGSAASLGVPARNVFSILPDTLGGEKVTYIILDDASDPTNAAKHAQALIDQGVDLIIGSQIVPATAAIAQVASAAGVAQIAPSPIPPPLFNNPWVFTVPQSMPLAMRPVVDHMKKTGLKTVAFIGFADPLGDLILNSYSKYADSLGIQTSAAERYNRTDTSVSAQVLKITAARPEAVVIGGTGSPGALPQIALAARRYQGQVYSNHGIINADFLRVGGAAVENTIAPTGPVMVAEQLPDSAPTKAAALTFLKAYEGKFGADSRNAFAAYYYDSYLIADSAVKRAKSTAKPGTPEFRKALRDAIASTQNLSGVHAVYTMKPGNVNVDDRSIVLVRVKQGKWELLK